MHDDLTWGIDLSESPWRCARLLAGSGAASLGEEAREIPGRDLLRESGAFLLPAASGDPYRPVLDDWADLRDWLRQERDSIRAHLPERHAGRGRLSPVDAADPAAVLADRARVRPGVQPGRPPARQPAGGPGGPGRLDPGSHRPAGDPGLGPIRGRLRSGSGPGMDGRRDREGPADEPRDPGADPPAQGRPDLGLARLDRPRGRRRPPRRRDRLHRAGPVDSGRPHGPVGDRGGRGAVRPLAGARIVQTTVRSRQATAGRALAGYADPLHRDDPSHRVDRGRRPRGMVLEATIRTGHGDPIASRVTPIGDRPPLSTSTWPNASRPLTGSNAGWPGRNGPWLCSAGTPPTSTRTRIRRRPRSAGRWSSATSTTPCAMRAHSAKRSRLDGDCPRGSAGSRTTPMVRPTRFPRWVDLPRIGENRRATGVPARRPRPAACSGAWGALHSRGTAVGPTCPRPGPMGRDAPRRRGVGRTPARRAAALTDDPSGNPLSTETQRCPNQGPLQRV